MKRSLKSNFQKSSMPWILLSFVDLMPSLHNQKPKPNAHTLKAALKVHEQTWKKSLKAQN